MIHAIFTLSTKKTQAARSQTPDGLAWFEPFGKVCLNLVGFDAEDQSELVVDHLLSGFKIPVIAGVELFAALRLFLPM